MERGVGRRGRREEEGEGEREDVEERTRNSLTYNPVHWSTLHTYFPHCHQSNKVCF